MEGAETQYRHLLRSLPSEYDWTPRFDVVAPTSTPVTFFEVSNPAESGLVDVARLKSLWRHLEVTHATSVSTPITLEELLGNSEGSVNWLVLDCLPAGDLLKPALEALQDIDVAVIRGVTEKLDVLTGAHHEHIFELLTLAGLTRLCLFPERNPVLAHALYIRNVERLSKDLLTAREGLRRTANEQEEQQQRFQKRLAELTHAAEEHEKHRLQLHTLLQRVQAEAAKRAEAFVTAAKTWEVERAELTNLQQATEIAAQGAASELKQLYAQLHRAQQEAQHHAELLATARTGLEMDNARLVQELRATQDAAQRVAQEVAQLQAQLQQTRKDAKLLASLLVAGLNERKDELVPVLQMQPNAEPTDKGSDKPLRNEPTPQPRTEGSTISTKSPTTQSENSQRSDPSQHALQTQELWEGILKESETRLRQAIGKDLENLTRQIESFIAIQNYLNTGDTISGFHGWPISPDAALFLVELFRMRHHDVVIEFGSGTSTLLFAKMLRMEDRKSSDPERNKLWKLNRIHTFEHDTTYLAKTRSLLETNKLSNNVALYHAPLTTWSDDSGSYLYYNCSVTLSALAQELGTERRRILVFVDGPPSATCKNARYPAIPILFNHFGQHEIDIVLDDAYRQDEKNAINLWRGFWKKRSIHIKDGLTQSEKGLYWAQNYESN